MIYTIALSSRLPIEESLERSGNNIKLELNDTIILEALFIVHGLDIAFIRSNVY